MPTLANIETGLTIKQALPVLARLIAVNQPVMLWGDTGIGKSELVAQIAQAHGAMLVDFRAILRESIDLRGLPAVNSVEGWTQWMRPSDLPFVGNESAFPSDRPIFLFMDEINTASPSMMAACFGLVLERRAGEHVLMPNVRIIAAGNRTTDRGAANRMPTPLANRFAHITIIADLDSWCEHAARLAIEPMLIAFLRFRRDAKGGNGMLHTRDGSDMVQFATPRGWFAVAKVIAGITDSSLRYQLAQSIVGTAPATELASFWEVYSELPRMADIESNPDSAIVPANTAATYGTTEMVARNVTRQNVAACARYAQRLPKPFEIRLVSAAVARDESLKETPAFVEWALRNQDVTL